MTRFSCICVGLTAICCWTPPVLQAGLLTFVDSRRDFEHALVANAASTCIDTQSRFSADPLPQTRVSKLSRSGLITGMAFSYTAYDIDFSTRPTGVLDPGLVGGDIADLDTFGVETPVKQDGAYGMGSWGIDSSGGSRTSRNALLIDFTRTPDDRGVGHFGVDLHDFEATQATPGSLRVYDDGVLMFHQDLTWATNDGDGQSHFVGVVATQADAFFDQVAIVVGDNGPGHGFTQRWAADRITFGQASNPEPSSVVIFGVVLCVFGGAHWCMVRRRTQSHMKCMV